MAPDEVPAILQRGEMVIPKDQVGAFGAAAAPPEVGVRIINAFDEATVTNVMRSATGEQIIVNAIRRNSMSVRGILA